MGGTVRQPLIRIKRLLEFSGHREEMPCRGPWHDFWRPPPGH